MIGIVCQIKHCFKEDARFLSNEVQRRLIRNYFVTIPTCPTSQAINLFLNSNIKLHVNYTNRIEIGK